MFKKLLGIAPNQTEDGAFSPSRLSLKLATSAKTNYDGGVYQNPYTGGKARVLVVLTEERNMMMANGRKFSTGNHPVEMALPMLHLINAGFELDLVTPTGAPAIIEQWAMPNNDKSVAKLFAKYDDALAKPNSLIDFANNLVTDLSLLGIAHCSIIAGAPVGVTRSNSKPALIRCSIGKAISTGWFPVENFLPFAIIMLRSSVRTTSTRAFPPI